jgi:transketolase
METKIKRNSRGVFMEAIEALVAKDPKIILICGDVGFSYLQEFEKKFPKRYFNLGITEQSMMLIASALALSGFKPYVYSMINFVTFRPYEMVRNGICYHNANVKLIGVQGGLHYNFLGYSHNIYGNEDIKILEDLPNMRTHVPSSPEQVADIVREMYKHDGPEYIRL